MSKAKSDKYLILIDLDGTLLKNSSKGEVNESDVKAIHRAVKAGHIVCIATGRPWRSTAQIYKKLQLNTVVANYNGAHIHNPTDYDFQPYITNLNLNDVTYILGDKKLRKQINNIAFEGPGWVQLKKRDEKLESVFGFSSASKFKLGIDFHKLPLKPTGVIVDTKKGVIIKNLLDYLRRTYGDLVEFSSWSKGQSETPVLDMTASGVTKSKALSLISRYYKIPVKQTISIGDGYNDIPMFRTTEISVAMANASDDIKQYATWVTTKTNQEGGVGEFLNMFLDNINQFANQLKKQRKLKYELKEEIGPNHL